jgi:hypothetical protein
MSEQIDARPTVRKFTTIGEVWEQVERLGYLSIDRWKRLTDEEREMVKKLFQPEWVDLVEELKAIESLCLLHEKT